MWKRYHLKSNTHLPNHHFSGDHLSFCLGCNFPLGIHFPLNSFWVFFLFFSDLKGVFVHHGNLGNPPKKTCRLLEFFCRSSSIKLTRTPKRHFFQNSLEGQRQRIGDELRLFLERHYRKFMGFFSQLSAGDLWIFVLAIFDFQEIVSSYHPPNACQKGEDNPVPTTLQSMETGWLLREGGTFQVQRARNGDDGWYSKQLKKVPFEVHNPRHPGEYLMRFERCLR